MSRFKGTFIFGANFEVGIEGPLDARQVVGTYADLTLPATWCLSPTCSNMALFNGMIVAVGSDGSNNGIYYLCDSPNYTMTCSWIKVGTGTGAGTVTGATNGLRLINSGTTVALGGNLLSGTTINGQSLYELNLIDLSGFHVSGGTTEIMLVPAGITLSHSGTSVSLDSNAGLTYDGDYENDFVDRSLVTKQFVTGLTGALQSEINYISGVTDTKLNISTYSAYTASTSGIISNAITGATNGLTKIPNHDVCLGGTISSSVILTDGRAPASRAGIQYGADYSASFIPESLVTKRYVDVIASGLKPKAAVKVATTGPIVLSGLTQTIDTITPFLTGDRILVKNQSSGATNGIYSASTGSWGRTADFDASGEVVSGAYMWVLTGSTNENTAWVLDTPDPITVGVTPMSFVLFSQVSDVIGGTGITVTMQTGIHTVSLNNQTQNLLAQAVTGVTGSGTTSVSKVGNDLIIFSSGGTQLYNYGSPSICPAGGMCVGTVLTGKTALKLLQEILVPELCGTITAPSTSIALTYSGLYEIGCPLSQSVSGSFSRGCINPQYCSVSDKRSGCAISYSFTGCGMPVGFQACVLTPATQTNPSYVVSAGTSTWGVCTCYGAGSPALGNAGTQFASALSAGCTSQSQDSVVGVYPIYGTTVNITTLTKQALQNMTTANCVQINLVADVSPNKQKFEVPCAWLSARPLVGVQQWNTVSSIWEYPGGSAGSSLAIWCCGAGSETVQGNSVGYCLYTYCSTDRSAVCIRLVF